MDGPTRTTRWSALVAATAAGLVLLVAGPAATGLDVAVGWAAVATGIGAWGRRPGSRTWLLTVALGLVWWLRCVDADLAALHVGVLVHLLVTIPTGRTGTWPRRSVVAAGYAVGIPLAAFGPSLALAVLWVVALGPLVTRWRDGGSVERRALLPALAGAVAVVLAELAAGFWPPAAAAAVLAWALALAAGLLRRSLDRATVHDLAAELRVRPAAGSAPGCARRRAARPDGPARAPPAVGIRRRRRRAGGPGADVPAGPRPGWTATGTRSGCSSTTPRSPPSRISSGPSRPGRRSRWRTSGCTPRSAAGCARWRPRGPASWRPPTPPASSSSATSTAGSRSDWPPSRCCCASRGDRSGNDERGATARRGRHRAGRAPWPTCGSWPGASTRCC